MTGKQVFYMYKMHFSVDAVYKKQLSQYQSLQVSK